MSDTNKEKFQLPSSFYEKYIQDDENMQAKIKPILNQIQENRVAVKELHTQYGIKFSEIINSYQNRLEELKISYEEQTTQFQAQQADTLSKCKELLDSLKNEHI